LEELRSSIPSENVVFLVDEHTLQCFKAIGIDKDEVVVIPAGEQSKSLEICQIIYDKLIGFNVHRKSTVVCIGGGVVTDIGAFCASTFLRGIKYIHVPTSLLAMTDAAIGGKNGVNFRKFKNYIGTFSRAETILIHPPFLNTLPADELRSGYAEMIKHALIKDEELWTNITSQFTVSAPPDIKTIVNSIDVKLGIVEQDRNEQGIRKLLNLGHTLAHAFESLVMAKNQNITHGDAVAAGIICESYISMKRGVLPLSDLDQITGFIDLHYPKIEFGEGDFESLYSYCIADKKGKSLEINCTLLERIGSAKIDQIVSKSEVLDALNFYQKRGL